MTKFHIYKYSSDKESLCGPTNKNNGLFIDTSGFSPADFFSRIWRRSKFKNRCQHCQKHITSKNFTYK